MNIHFFDLDGTLCEESWILTDTMIDTLIQLSFQTNVYITTWRWFPSLQKALKYNQSLLQNINCITENWWKCNNGTLIYHFNLSEIHEIWNFLQQNITKIQYFDYWFHNKLYTFSSRNIQDEHEYRKYYTNIKDILNIFYHNSNTISMVYIKLYETINYKFKHVSQILWDNDIILTHHNINKSYHLQNIENYDNLFVYGNWTNDIPLFLSSKANKINIGIGTHPMIIQLSNLHFSSYHELEKYVQNLIKNYS